MTAGSLLQLRGRKQTVGRPPNQETLSPPSTGSTQHNYATVVQLCSPGEERTERQPGWVGALSGLLKQAPCPVTLQGGLYRQILSALWERVQLKVVA